MFYFFTMDSTSSSYYVGPGAENLSETLLTKPEHRTKQTALLINWTPYSPIYVAPTMKKSIARDGEKDISDGRVLVSVLGQSSNTGTMSRKSRSKLYSGLLCARSPYYANFCMGYGETHWKSELSA